MTSLIIVFAVRPTCVQDSLFKMSSESPEGSCNPSSSKTKTYLCYTINIMDADVLATHLRSQGISNHDIDNVEPN